MRGGELAAVTLSPALEVLLHGQDGGRGGDLAGQHVERRADVFNGVAGAERLLPCCGHFQGLGPVRQFGGLHAPLAVLSEVGEEWETGKIYLNTEGMPA